MKIQHCFICDKDIDGTLTSHLRQCHKEFRFEYIGDQKGGNYYCAECTKRLRHDNVKNFSQTLLEHYKFAHPEQLGGQQAVGQIENRENKSPVSFNEDDVIMAINAVMNRMNKAESAIKPLNDEIARLKSEAAKKDEVIVSQSREIASLTAMNGNIRAERDDYKDEVARLKKRAILNLPVMQEMQNIQNAR